jgi:hypothetical protein
LGNGKDETAQQQQQQISIKCESSLRKKIVHLKEQIIFFKTGNFCSLCQFPSDKKITKIILRKK